MKLNETKIKQIVNESIKKILKENVDDVSMETIEDIIDYSYDPEEPYRILFP